MTSVSGYDVVPPIWITADGGGELGEKNERERAVAFVFPSLAYGDLATQPVRANLPNFFRPEGRFDAGVFEWIPIPESGDTIKIKTAQTGINAVIEIDVASTSQIRKLDWERFKQLQGPSGAGYRRTPPV
jgi:hypothetical protein